MLCILPYCVRTHVHTSISNLFYPGCTISCAPDIIRSWMKRPIPINVPKSMSTAFKGKIVTIKSSLSAYQLSQVTPLYFFLIHIFQMRSVAFDTLFSFIFSLKYHILHITYIANCNGLANKGLRFTYKLRVT